MKLEEQFAQNLRFYMQLKNIQQKEVAKRLGVSASTVSYWIRGLQMPRTDKIDKLCTMLMIEREQLLSSIEADTEKIKQRTGIGERIKQLRNERQLSMDMLIADMEYKFPEHKINKGMLSRWENEQNEPSLESVKYLSLYFDVSADYLVGLTSVRTPLRLLTKNKKQ